MSSTPATDDAPRESAQTDHGKVLPPTVFTTPPSKKAGEVAYSRVRRRNTTDESAGPVLRTNVKPVKRFRPDSSPDKSNPSPSRRKRSKTTKDSAKSNDNNNGLDYTALTKSPDETKGKKPTKKAAAKVEAMNGEAPPKKKRVWEQWSVDDKNCFFDAVAMYGKDFEAVTSAVALRYKKRGEESMAKTKDQVRHLYYRTWTTISKLINTEAYPSFTNRAFREMSAVINYGEIHKKLGGTLSMKKQAVEKLNELVKFGATNMRIKGKNIRIKTPACQALKKINKDVEAKGNAGDSQLARETRRIKVPLTVPFELLPLDMTSWMNVQSLAQNPRLRINVPAHHALSFLFDFLLKKWDTEQSKSLAFMQGTSKQEPHNQKNITNQLMLQTPSECSMNERLDVLHVTVTKTHCVVTYYLKKMETSKVKTSANNTEKTDSSNNKVQEKNPTERTVETPVKNAIDVTHSDDCLSMTSQEDTMDESSSSPKNLNSSSQNVEILDEKENDFIANISLDNTIVEQNITITDESQNVSNETNKTSANVSDRANNENNTPLMNCSTMPTTNKTESEIGIVNVCSDKGAQLTSGEVTLNLPNVEKRQTNELLKSCETTEDKIKCTIETVKPKKKRKRTLRLRTSKRQMSWTMETSESITIAEIYMMLGKPAIIKLFYKWNSPAPKSVAHVNKPKKGRDLQLSPGLNALLQLSKILLNNSKKQSTSSKLELNKLVSPPKSRQNLKTKIKFKETSTQCDIQKQPKNTPSNESNTPSSNPRGRGVNKFVSLTPDFVVPRVPMNKYKPITSTNGKPKQTISEEALKKLMQRARSSKSFRRPIEHMSIVPKPVNKIKKMISYSIVPNINASHNGLVVTTTSLYKPIAPKIVTATNQSSHFKPIVTSTQNTKPSNNTQPQNEQPSEDILAKAINESQMDENKDIQSTNDVSDILSMAAEQTGLTTSNTEIQNIATMVRNVETATTSVSSQQLYPLPNVDTGSGILQSVPHTTNYTTPENKVASSTSNTDASLQFGWSEDSMTGLSSQLEDLVKKMVNPNNDVTLTSLTSKNQDSSTSETPQCLSPTPVLVGNFDKDLLGISPSKTDATGGNLKSNEIPAHPWTINMSSREGLGLTNLLNTPQKVFPSEVEDSVDGYKSRRSSEKAPSSLHDHSSLLPENEVEIQLQCMLNENSVDYVSKFQELVRHTQQEEEFALVDTSSSDIPDSPHKQENKQTKNSNELCANLAQS